MPNEIINLGPTTGVSNIVIPAMGPRVLACRLNFSDTTSIDVFTLLSIYMQNIDFVQGAYIDNSANENPLQLTIADTQQNITVPARAQGYWPILFTSIPNLTVTTVQADVDVPFHFYNVPIQAQYWLTNDVAPTPSAGGLTDTQLRATPVPVSGPLTDTQLRAVAVPVSGPLTDTQMRATPVKTATTGGAYTDRSIAGLTGATQVLMAANANRRLLFVNNIGATPIAVNLTGNPAVMGGVGCINISAGGALLLDVTAPTAAINIIGTVAANVSAWEA